ncbi:hypothetical protein VCHA53O466_50546 [Vibrio chagasii]|nr:hypothetical protein VCHA53O466_50546 [Vibrio chagasii]
MKISKYVMLTSALMLGGCGGGSPDDIPNNMAVFSAIDGFSATGKGCTVTRNEYNRFFDSQKSCDDILGGDADMRAMPVTSGVSSFALEDVKEYFVADINFDQGLATYNSSKSLLDGEELRASSLGHSRKTFQLVSESRGSVANPFTTIIALMDSRMTIDDIGSRLSLSPSLLSSNYLTYIEGGVGSPNYQDALFAQAVGRGVISILPEYLGERENAEYYHDLMSNLMDEATHLEEYIPPEELSFVVNADANEKYISPIRIPYSFDNAMDFVQSEGRKWRLVDFGNNWDDYEIYASEGTMSVSSVNTMAEYNYEVNSHHNISLNDSKHVERFFYTSEDVMFSDQLTDAQVNDTIKLWLNDSSDFDEGTSVNESDFESGHEYFIMFTRQNSSDKASLGKIEFLGNFEDKNGQYPSICEHRESKANFTAEYNSSDLELTVTTKCGAISGEPNEEDNAIRFYHSDMTSSPMKEIMNNEEMIILRDTSGGEIMILFRERHLAKQMYNRWHLSNLHVHY